MQNNQPCELDKGKISSSQFMFTIICYLQSSSLLLAIATSVTKSDTWIVCLFATLTSLPFILIYISLMKNFPGENLFSLNTLVFGKVGGKFVSALYLFFFMTLTSLNLRDLGDFVKRNVLVKTPEYIILVILILVAAYSVRYGIKSIAKYTTLLCITAVVIMSLTLLLAFQIMDLGNILPFFDFSADKYIQATHIVTTIPFGECVVLLMFMPNVEIKKTEVGKRWLIGFFFGAASLVVIALRDIAVFGDQISIYTFPSFETHKLLSVFQSINRIEIFFAVELITLKYVKIALLFYVSVRGLAQLLGLKSYRQIILVSGVIITVYALVVYQSNIDHMAAAQQREPIFFLLFELILPLTTLIIAKARKLPQKTGGAGN